MSHLLNRMPSRSGTVSLTRQGSRSSSSNNSNNNNNINSLPNRGGVVIVTSQQNQSSYDHLNPKHRVNLPDHIPSAFEGSFLFQPTFLAQGQSQQQQQQSSTSYNSSPILQPAQPPSFHQSKSQQLPTSTKSGGNTAGPTAQVLRLPPIMAAHQQATNSQKSPSSSSFSNRKSPSMQSSASMHLLASSLYSTHANLFASNQNSQHQSHQQQSQQQQQQLQFTSNSSKASLLEASQYQAAPQPTSLSSRSQLFYEPNKILRVKDFRILREDFDNNTVARAICSPNNEDAVTSAQRNRRLQNFESKVHEYLKQISIKKDFLKAKQSDRIYKSIEASLESLKQLNPVGAATGTGTVLNHSNSGSIMLTAATNSSQHHVAGAETLISTPSAASTPRKQQQLQQQSRQQQLSSFRNQYPESVDPIVTDEEYVHQLQFQQNNLGYTPSTPKRTHLSESCELMQADCEFTRTYYQINEMQFEALSKTAVESLTAEEKANYFEVLRHLDSFAHRFQVTCMKEVNQFDQLQQSLQISDSSSVMSSRSSQTSSRMQQRIRKNSPMQSASGCFGEVVDYDGKIAEMQHMHQMILKNLTKKSFVVRVPKNFEIRSEHYNDFYARLADQPNVEMLPEVDNEEEDEGENNQNQSQCEDSNQQLQNLSSSSHHSLDADVTIQPPAVDPPTIPEPEAIIEDQNDPQFMRKQKHRNTIDRTINISIIPASAIAIPAPPADNKEEDDNTLPSQRGRCTSRASKSNRSRNSSRFSAAPPPTDDRMNESSDDEMNTSSNNYSRGFMGKRSPRMNPQENLPSMPSPILNSSRLAAVGPAGMNNMSTFSLSPSVRSNTVAQTPRQQQQLRGEDEGFERSVGEYIDIVLVEQVSEIEFKPAQDDDLQSLVGSPKIVPNTPRRLEESTSLDLSVAPSPGKRKPNTGSRPQLVSQTSSMSQSIYRRENTARLNVSEARGGNGLQQADSILVNENVLAEPQQVSVLGTGLLDRLLKCTCIADIDLNALTGHGHSGQYSIKKPNKRVEIDKKVRHQTEFDRQLFSKLTQWQYDIAEENSDFRRTLVYTQLSVLDSLGSLKRDEFFSEVDWQETQEQSMMQSSMYGSAKLKKSKMSRSSSNGYRRASKNGEYSQESGDNQSEEGEKEDAEIDEIDSQSSSSDLEKELPDDPDS